MKLCAFSFALALVLLSISGATAQTSMCDPATVTISGGIASVICGVPAPAPTPVPTPVPTPIPTPVATVAPAPTIAPTVAPTPVGYTYAGCSMFPGTAGGHSGGWYNTDVSAVAVESDSAALIANYVSSGAGAFSISVNLPTLEVINTPASVSLKPIAQSAYGTPPSLGTQTATLPGPAALYSGTGAPVSGSLLIEGVVGSDGHYNVISKANCQYWVSGATSWNGSGFNVWNAAVYDLTKPQPLTTEYGSTGDCCGLPLAAFLIKPGELKAGVIRHALGWTSPGNEGGISPVDPNRFVPPAVEAQGGAACTTPAPCMPYGGHIRLKASFSDAAFSPAAKAVAEALKHYGAYLMDTGCCLSFAYLAQDWSGTDVDALWTAADESFIATIKMSNFDVIAPANSNAPN